jgi:hypothetical protein
MGRSWIHRCALGHSISHRLPTEIQQIVLSKIAGARRQAGNHLGVRPA